MQSKMMAYDRAVGELNAARLRGTSCPIIHLLMQAAASLNAEVNERPFVSSVVIHASLRPPLRI